ncbi:MAG: bifunctional 23S rRNA (guanine(2069)-N(7))-methyltransferase RlmK/23S rRNA (guanine(2445)-N(2))-methyltransferase RlmL [Deltaproteobacteria bacterium]|nr:bifunctional 23S rRNA (guanine(2069)-N(7))-methyltransferase RlmK/23S rRNA (guanine(2445)-N(2))-methyltransferase RlmL [Deltaproteobacteria bacterium]
MYEFFATCSRGLEAAVVSELATLGVVGRPTMGGVAFEGDLALAYRATLWLRAASRLLLVLRHFSIPDEAALYDEVGQLDWVELSREGATLAVDCAGHSPALRHTRFASQRVKDAVVDQLRARRGARPDVDLSDPDLRLNLHLAGEEATLALDLGGGSLHRRGYRYAAAPAPLRENLAAGLLILAGWSDRVLGLPGAEPAVFCDPLCGSGTLAIEAALIAADVAPGLLRGPRLGSPGWQGHDREVYEALVKEAEQRDRRRRAPDSVSIFASDIDAGIVGVVRSTVARLGLSKWMDVAVADVGDYLGDRPSPAPRGLMVTNPPYGERLGELYTLERLYLVVGKVLRARFFGWTAHILAGNRDLTRALGLKAERRVVVFNGPIECRLLNYPIAARTPLPPSPSGGGKKAGRDGPLREVRRLLRDSASAEMLANRLRKNEKRLRRWVSKEGIEAYRVYDADLPEYASAIDRYGDKLAVHEYAAPRTVDPRRAEDRLHDTLVVAAETLGVDPEDVFLKVRERQRGDAQYERAEASGERFVIHEGGLRFWVNLQDYIDTGIFLDYRPVRQLVSELAKDKRFLNLFAYTGTASVYAAKGGARTTTSVDLSRTYLDWARENFRQNGISGDRNTFDHADVRVWLEEAAERRDRYEVILCDPPTFSASKRMEITFEVERDHVALLRAAREVLAPEGTIIFSCNKRSFHLDQAEVEALGFQVDDITAQSIPPDFTRVRPIHRAFRLRWR